jgi:hypothetical protein
VFGLEFVNLTKLKNSVFKIAIKKDKVAIGFGRVEDKTKANILAI